MQMNTYRKGEALTSKMTAAQWLRRFDATTLKGLEDPTKAVKEVEQAARKVSKFLRLPVTKDRTFAPVVFELAYSRDVPGVWA
jgi:hypothetical protein